MGMLRIVGLFLLVLVSTGTGIAVCEVIVRLAHWAPDVHVIDLDLETSAFRPSSNPILAYELRPGYRNPKADLSTAFEFVNSQGLRDRERPFEKPRSVRRVIVLGDSVALGLGLKLDEIIARRVEAALGRDDVEVLSFAVTGYGTRQEVELLRTRGLQYAPDVVVVLFVENDWALDSTHFSLARLDRPRPVQELFRHSAVFRLLSLRLNWFGFGEDADVDAQAIRSRTAVEADRRRRGTEGLDHVSDALRLLAELGCEHGFVPAVAVWPTFPPGKIMDRVFPGTEPDVLKIERLAWNEGMPTLRLSEAFLADFAVRRAAAPSDEPQDPKQLYALDEMHPTPRGAEVAGRAIARWLVETPGLLGEQRSCEQPLPSGQPIAGCACGTRHAERTRLQR